MTIDEELRHDMAEDRPAAEFRNLSDLLIRASKTSPRSGVCYLGGADANDPYLQTYPSLLRDARRLLGGLRGRGLCAGSRVVLLFERPQDFIPAFWACVLGGYIPCPLAPLRTDTSRWEAQLGHVNTLLEGPLVMTSEDLRNEMPQVNGMAVANLEGLSASVPEATVHTAGRNDTALLLLTSGSTDSAKAVRLTHGNLLAAMSAKIERLDTSADEVTMNWISFDHVAAMESHLMPLYVGAVQLHVESHLVLGDPVRFLRLADTYRVTLTFTPNFLFGQVISELDRQPADFSPDLSALRYIISGGEAVVCATAHTFLDRLAAFGLARDVVVPAFGMTETCAGSVFSKEFPDADTGLEFASLGVPISGLELRVDTDGDVPVEVGGVGELQVRGPMVFDGYLNNDTATAAAFTADGWFRTGDLAQIIDGRLRLAGRNKDSIIVNGVNYFSHELETVLEQLDDVEKSYVAAFPRRPPGSDTEQLVVVFSTPVPLNDEPALHRLLIAIRSSVILHWGFRPSLILPLPKSEIPRTSLGKIQRSLLRKRLEAGEFAAVETWVAETSLRLLGGYTPPEGAAEVALAKIYADMFGAEPETMSSTASFFDLGGTSLDILRLKHNVEQRFGIQNLPVVRMLRAPTIQELAHLLTTADSSGDENYDPLVPLQTSGEKTPLFCVHPGVGEVLVFVNLAKYLVNERPFYALRARGFGAGETHFASFSEMVECYVRAIRAEQPSGPYAVAGYSYGGVVAFEIAKMLESQGERVDFVGIFNLPPHIRDRMQELDFVAGAVNLAFFLSLVTKDQAAELSGKLREGLTREQQLRYLIDIAPKKRLAELDLDLSKFTAWVELAQSLVNLGLTYEPSGNVKSFSVFYAIPLSGTKEDWLNNQLRAWDGFAREPNRYIDVPGEHYTLMGAKHVSTFQAVLCAELDRALDDG